MDLSWVYFGNYCKEVSSKEENAFLFYQVMLVSHLSCLGVTILSVPGTTQQLNLFFSFVLSFKEHWDKQLNFIPLEAKCLGFCLVFGVFFNSTAGIGRCCFKQPGKVQVVWKYYCAAELKEFRWITTCLLLSLASYR